MIVFPSQNKMNGLRAFVYIMLLWPSVCQSARILVLSPVGSKSHKFSLVPIVKGLIERGHIVIHAATIVDISTIVGLSCSSRQQVETFKMGTSSRRYASLGGSIVFN